MELHPAPDGEPDAAADQPPIVVGFDGSPASEAAVRWALVEAERRQLGVTVIQSWHEPILSDRTWTERWDDPEFEERRAAEALQHAVGQMSAGHPTVPCVPLLVPDRASDALIAAGDSHQMVVVGSRGRGGFTGLALGSVAERVAGSAPVTVVVVRGEPVEQGDVVVGVDGSSGSRRALHWAMEEPRAPSARVRAVLCWTDLTPIGDHGAEPLRATTTDADERITLHHIVSEELGPGHDAELAHEALHGPTARTLLEAAQEAQLLVLGAGSSASGEGPHHLSSLARQVLRHAPCPVAIAR